MAIGWPSYRHSRIEWDESRLLSPSLFVADEPRRLIGDHSDAPDAAPAKRGIEMIYHSNRIAKTQDGRSLEAAMEDRTHEQPVAELPLCLRAQGRKLRRLCTFGVRQDWDAISGMSSTDGLTGHPKNSAETIFLG